MASYEKRRRKKGIVWIASIRLAGFKPESKTFRTRAEAKDWAEEREDELRNGGSQSGTNDIEIGRATDRVIGMLSQSMSRNTIKGYECCQTQLLSYFGEKRKLSEITTPDFADYILKRTTEDKVGPSKIRQESSFIRKVYETAALWGVKLPSPEADIKRPAHRVKSSEDEFAEAMSDEEIVHILQEASASRNKMLCPFLLFLLFTGMRPSEAAALYWTRQPDEKELMRGKFHVGYYDIERGGFSRVGTKTVQRFVPAHPVTVKILDTIQKTGKYIFVPDRREQHPRPYHRFKKTFETHRRKSEVRQDIDFYSFRHTARTRMAACGVQDSAADKIIGHVGKSMRMVYTHWQDADLISEMGKLNYPMLELFLTAKRG